MAWGSLEFGKECLSFFDYLFKKLISIETSYKNKEKIEFVVRYKSQRETADLYKTKRYFHEQDGTFGGDIKDLAGCEVLWLYKSLRRPVPIKNCCDSKSAAMSDFDCIHAVKSGSTCKKYMGR
jgi:hypothetical protein